MHGVAYGPNDPVARRTCTTSRISADGSGRATDGAKRATAHHDTVVAGTPSLTTSPAAGGSLRAVGDGSNFRVRFLRRSTQVSGRAANLDKESLLLIPRHSCRLGRPPSFLSGGARRLCRDPRFLAEPLKLSGVPATLLG